MRHFIVAVVAATLVACEAPAHDVDGPRFNCTVTECEPISLPVVTRHGGDVHIVLDDGTLFVVPEFGCVVIVRADEHEGACLE